MGLVSAAVSDLPQAVQDLAESQVVAGWRAEIGVSIPPGRLPGVSSGAGPGFGRKAGTKTVALAPEAGSERLRRIINKHLSEEELAAGGGDPDHRRQCPICGSYFMVGLPGETDDDLEELIALAQAGAPAGGEPFAGPGGGWAGSP